jgi:hypothetical protein
VARRRVWTALAVAVGSGAASVVLRRRRGSGARRADLYFDDGSMLSFPDGAPEADRLLELATSALRVAGRREV